MLHLPQAALLLALGAVHALSHHASVWELSPCSILFAASTDLSAIWTGPAALLSPTFSARS